MESDSGEAARGNVGIFTYTAETDTWWWSEGMYRLYGYGPAEEQLSVELLRDHKHPDDAERATRAREESMRTGGVYSCYHRIIDTGGTVRSVHTVARSITGRDGSVGRVEGFCVDLTTVRRAETEVEVHAALVGISEHRATIDQAKGMVMVAVGCTGDEAFDCLRRYSQNANVKLHDIAARIVDAVEAERGGTEVVVQVLADLVGGRRGTVPEPTP